MEEKMKNLAAIIAIFVIGTATAFGFTFNNNHGETFREDLFKGGDCCQISGGVRTFDAFNKNFDREFSFREGRFLDHGFNHTNDFFVEKQDFDA
jgi:hypothetical protein